MSKVLVTGATGFIGSTISKKLLQSGAKVYGVGRDSNKLDFLKQYGDFVPIQLDFAKYGKLADVVDDKNIDTFYHLAWLAFGANSFDVDIQIANITASCTALRIAKKLNVKKFVMAGSYYELKMSAQIEHATNCEKYDSIFGICKHCATELLRNIANSYDVPYVSVYIPKVFGPGDKANSAPVIIARKMLVNEDVRLTVGENSDDWVFIDDIADGIIATANANPGKYYVGHRNFKTFKKIIIDMKTALNSQSRLLFGEYPDNSYIDYTKLDLNALYNDTGFECKSDFAESMQKLAEWLKEDNSIKE